MEVVELPARLLRNSTRMVRPAEQLSSEEISHQRLQIGLAAGTGFLFVVLCAVLVKLVSCLSSRKEYDVMHSDQQADEQEERANILADVYGKPDVEEMDIGDEEALERAWQAIERAATSDEDLGEVDLKHCDDLSRMPKRGLSGSAAEVFDSSPMGKSVNATAMSALFDIGDDDGPTFKGERAAERGPEHPPLLLLLLGNCCLTSHCLEYVFSTYQ